MGMVEGIEQHSNIGWRYVAYYIDGRSLSYIVDVVCRTIVLPSKVVRPGWGVNPPATTLMGTGTRLWMLGKGWGQHSVSVVSAEEDDGWIVRSDEG